MKKTLIIILTSLIFPTLSYAESFKVQVNPLHYAVSINETEYVKKLIEEAPELASQLNDEGLTPIHLAIKENSIGSLKTIMKNNINPNIKNSKGETPLVYAIKNKKPQAVSFLVNEKTNKTIKDNNGHDAFYYAKISTKEINNLVNKKETKEVKPVKTIKKEAGINQNDFELKMIKIINEKNELIIKKINDINEDFKIKNSLLSDTIKKNINEIKILKIENEDLKLSIKNMESENNDNYKKIWDNEILIKKVIEDKNEIERIKLMGVYAKEKNLPELNPIIDINKEVKTIKETPTENNIINNEIEKLEKLDIIQENKSESEKDSFILKLD